MTLGSADVARLALRVVGARLRCDRYGRRALLIGMILLGTAAALYLLTLVLVTSFLPVGLLASRPAVARLAPAALLGQVGKRGSAARALREDHRVLDDADETRGPCAPALTTARTLWALRYDLSGPVDEPSEAAGPLRGLGAARVAARKAASFKAGGRDAGF